MEQEAIFIKSKFLPWDVTDSLSNTDLIREMTLASNDYKNRIFIVANFNGFLEKERKRAESQSQLEELFRHASGDQSIVIWIEPDMNRATSKGGLFAWLTGFCKGVWKRFTKKISAEVDENHTSSANFQLILKPTETAPVRLAVMPIKLERSQ